MWHFHSSAFDCGILTTWHPLVARRHITSSFVNKCFPPKCRLFSSLIMMLLLTLPPAFVLLLFFHSSTSIDLILLVSVSILFFSPPLHCSVPLSASPSSARLYQGLGKFSCVSPGVLSDRSFVHDCLFRFPHLTITSHVT